MDYSEYPERISVAEGQAAKASPLAELLAHLEWQRGSLEKTVERLVIAIEPILAQSEPPHPNGGVTTKPIPAASCHLARVITGIAEQLEGLEQRVVNVIGRVEL